MTDPTVHDLLILLLPPARMRKWMRASFEQSRKRGKPPPDSYWRYLERIERIAPYIDALAANIKPEQWHDVESWLFRATKEG